MKIESLIRPNILNLKPYSSARHEFSGHGEVFLDANENPFENEVNRYPDPLQQELKQVIGKLKHVPADQLFLGNGSDEVIDLIFRIFCRPGIDEILVLPPTYGMYQVSADIADIKVKKIRLNENYQPDVESILNQIGATTKVLFICSPNNPTGNLIEKNIIIKLIESFQGIVVIDEAYIDFSPEHSCLPLLSNYDNLIIMQTLSKAWGMAAIRLGMAFSSVEIISYFNKVKAPYNISSLTQQFAINKLNNEVVMKNEVVTILQEKKRLIEKLTSIGEVVHVFPSDTNFLLVKVKHADGLYQSFVSKGIVVRNRSREAGCEGCLRITIGTPSESLVLWDALVSFNSMNGE
ncbi:MAG: histidinol-phosphate transaminase [Saprospiraceae bacterium]